MGIALLTGTIVGMLSGLGVGGGSLLMLYLQCFGGMEPADARAVNLLFFLPAALISTWLHRKTGTAPKSILLCAALASAGFSVLGSWLSLHLAGEDLLRKAMGILFLLTGLREIRYRGSELR